MALWLKLLDDIDRDVYDLSPSYDFGLGLTPQCIQRYRHLPVSSLFDYSVPSWSQLARAVNEKENGAAGVGGGKVSPIGKDGFQVSMDVKQFKPSELNVKVVDNSIVVEGKHEERADNQGYISRHFVRRYALPKGYEAEKVTSSLSSDGVLTVSVPKPQAIEDKSKERVIQIQQTGPAHLNVKENPRLEDIGEEKDAD